MSESTIGESLKDLETFCDHHYETIRCAIIGLIGPTERVDDLVQNFVLKILEKDLLEKMPRTRSGFRRWLFTALRNHVIDDVRRTQARRDQVELSPDFEPPDPDETSEADVMQADVIYACGVLHLAMQRLRNHCVETGRLEVWAIFEGLILEGKLRDREAEMRRELRAKYDGQNAQFLDNRLTTAKRMLRRLLPETIPSSLTDRVDRQERFVEWQEIIRKAGEVPLFAALRVAPVPGSVFHEVNSEQMIEGGEASGASLSQAISRELGDDDLDDHEIGDDELSLLLSFRLSMPFADYLGDRYGPEFEGSLGGTEDSSGAPRRLLDLVEWRPYASNAKGVSNTELLTLLGRLKGVAKWTHNHPNHAFPPQISILIYNLSIALALVHCGQRIGNLPIDQLRQNLRWSLDRPWLDDRLRPIFRNALAKLGYVVCNS